MINYFPFSTFCFYKNNPININDPNKEYILKVVEDNFYEIAKKENIRFGNQNEGLKETEQVLFRTTSSTNIKKLCSVIKLSDYNIEDTCGLGNLLKNSLQKFLSASSSIFPIRTTKDISGVDKYFFLS